jgi:hypothetical protein
MTNNDIVNWGEGWYEFKYYSYRDGCICLYKMPEDEYQKLKAEYEELKDLQAMKKFKNVHDYIIAVLAFNA